MNEIISDNIKVGDDKKDEEVLFMLEEKEGILAWIKKYKKQLILAGISITTIVGIILGLKNRDTIMKLWETLAEKIKKTPVAETVTVSVLSPSTSLVESKSTTRPYTPPKEAFDVRGHIRNMRPGKHHSPQKALEAAALGIELLPNQTLVATYPKFVA